MQDIPLITSFGRRKSRSLSVEQLKLWNNVLPQYSITLQEETIIPKVLFSDKAEVWLEIGFGKGEHLAAKAENNHEIGFIGCEPYINGTLNMLKFIEEKKLANVKLWNEDARILLSKMADQSLGKIFILHPDPWPKLRHHKRRLISDQFLDFIATKLHQQGKLIISTDHQDYAKWILERLLSNKNFIWAEEDKDKLHRPPTDIIGTCYQQKAASMGIDSIYFEFTRK